MVILQEKKQYQQRQFASEKIPVVEVSSAAEFGHFIALDLLQWIEQNPKGVIALPTGRTPESFIRALQWYKKNWDHPIAKQNRVLWDISSQQFPSTKQLRFVQIDEFLWMSQNDPKSYLNYVSSYYFSILEIDKKNCLTIDFSQMGFDLDRLRKIIDQQGGYDLDVDNGYVQDALRRVRNFCAEYEQKIAEWGGIGYFLGGIGLDGHIAFNIAGSSIDSVTRIVELNKKSKQGFSQQSCYFSYAVTIGLKTIFQNSKTKIVLGALGKGKAQVVHEVVEGKVGENVPASLLQNHKNSIFVVSHSAAQNLTFRNHFYMRRGVSSGISIELLEKIFVTAALRFKKRLSDLVIDDFETEGQVVIDKIQLNLSSYIKIVGDRIKGKIERGLRGWPSQKIMHTAPHHDDIMLGYYPVIKNSPKSDHHMLYVVSGSNGISSAFLKKYLKEEAVDIKSMSIQEVKMRIREQEAELLWDRSRVKVGVTHLRSPFYSTSFFKSEPTYAQDVAPCLKVMNKIQPGLILVLNDSELQGPSTHHTAFSVVMQSVQAYRGKISVWGYRNVWDRYQIYESAVIVPVDQKGYDEQHDCFVKCFASQKKALYPSKNGLKPFSVYAQKIQKEQYQEMVTLLGKDYFEQHSDERMRNAVGLIFFEEIK